MEGEGHRACMLECEADPYEGLTLGWLRTERMCLPGDGVAVMIGLGAEERVAAMGLETW